MRGISLLALLLGILLIPFAGALAVGDHRDRVDAIERALTSEADQHAGDLDAYFARARATILLTANQAAFRRFDEAPGSRLSKLRRQAGDIDAAIGSLGYLEQLYPDAIGEACFIDRTGAEAARVVRGEVAPPRDLSTTEADAPFFHPTFALPFGQVYQTQPYRSPDTGEWVIANSTLVPSGDGVKRSIVHFEVTVESFRREFAADRDDYALTVVDRQSGRVVLDAGHPQRLGAPLGVPGDRRFARLARATAAAGITEVAGQPAAFRRVTRAPGNANDWVLVARSTAAAPALLGDLGPLPLTLLGVAALLVIFGAIGLAAERRELERAATVDALTGLSNRRRLVLDLERRLARGATDPAALMLFDLDGFKNYNDSFGHLAGDALLGRLGAALARVTAGRGAAYRLGGDEFCVLCDRDHAVEVEAGALNALSERGEGFAVGASGGVVLLPAEATDPTEALRIADQRMYSAKHSGRASAMSQSKDVLLRALAERHPDLGHDLDDLAQLAGEIARRLGIDGEELEAVRHAAELHDIGKVAIPEAILGKPGPLDQDEWEFMRRHTLIGERIVAAAPALLPASRLVRSSHERWDGDGYPDGLAGDAIPLGARIIAACDAYDAMTAERPYSAARTAEEAVAELRRCAGTQFDPAVVALLIDVLPELRTPRAGSARPARS